MLTMARSGAKVLHDRCVELAKKYGVVIEVCSSFSNAPGTLVCRLPHYSTGTRPTPQ